MQKIIWGLSLAVCLSSAAVASAHSRTQAPDRACATDCRLEHRACAAAARAEARLCVADTCTAAREAAAEACADDPRSTQCREAREAVRLCQQPCLDAHRAAIRECRATANDCIGECPGRTLPPRPAVKDATCLRECRAGLSNCLGGIRATSHECQVACRERAAELRQACANGRIAACQAARDALRECNQACSDTLRRSSLRCTNASNDCVADCPDSTPAPTGPTRGR